MAAILLAVVAYLVFGDESDRDRPLADSGLAVPKPRIASDASAEITTCRIGYDFVGARGKVTNEGGTPGVFRVTVEFLATGSADHGPIGWWESRKLTPRSTAEWIIAEDIQPTMISNARCRIKAVERISD